MLSPPQSSTSAGRLFPPVPESPENTLSPLTSAQAFEIPPPPDAARSIQQSQQRISAALSVPSLLHQIQQPHHQAHAGGESQFRRARVSFGSAAAPDGHYGDSEALISDESAGYPSPANGNPGEYAPTHRSRGSIRSGASIDRQRESFGTHAQEKYAQDYMQKAPTEDCCYKFLAPVLPFIRNIIPASVACDLLEIFLTDPGSSLFRGASPYILTRIFRKKSILHPTNPRYATPALLATILWCVAQTADVMVLHVPGTRAKIVNELYDLATSLISSRDPDRWRRIHGKHSGVTMYTSFALTSV